jgi:hypothetical protein
MKNQSVNEAAMPAPNIARTDLVPSKSPPLCLTIVAGYALREQHLLTDLVESHAQQCLESAFPRDRAGSQEQNISRP